MRRSTKSKNTKSKSTTIVNPGTQITAANGPERRSSTAPTTPAREGTPPDLPGPTGLSGLAEGGRWQRLGLRWRLMVIGLAGLTVSLAAAGTVLYAVLSANLHGTLADDARRAADEVATLAAQRRLPDPVPVSGALVVQVLDADLRVITGSALADRLTPLVTRDDVAESQQGESVVVPGSRTGLADRLLVATRQVGPADDRLTVIAAVPVGDAEVTLIHVRTSLLIGLPLLLAVLGMIAWRVIGSALQPVEQLRQGAERIGARTGHRERLPVPVARDEIQALAITLNGMLVRLAQLHERQRGFVADAAHELRSPLASLHTQLEVADRLGEGGELPAELLPQVGRLSRLVEDLLVLARTDSGALPHRTEPVDLSDLVTDVATGYAAARVPVAVSASAAPPAGTVSDRAGDTSLVVRANLDEVRRAIANLVDNAVRHARTEVTLRAQATPTGAELRVVDDGHGIPHDQRERVFDRFTRLQESRDRDSGGSGLGLPIARELLRRNGADVQLGDPAAGSGTEAVVTWPRAR